MDHAGTFFSKDTTDAIVVTCLSFRFRSLTEAAVLGAFGIEDYDLISLAGGAKNVSSPGSGGRRRAVFSDIALAVERHRVGKIILLNHQTCSSYAAEGRVFRASEREAERQFHYEELREAGRRMKKKFPSEEILLGYLVVADGKVCVEPVKA